MQAHTHAHCYAFGPGMSCNGALCIYRSQHSICGAGKCNEESITLRINLVTIPFLESSTQQASALCQYISILIAQLPEQACGTFDVGEEQGDCSCWKVTQRGPLR